MASSKQDPQALWNQLTQDDIVIIPAFGATNEDKAHLIRHGLSIRENDATCMLVERSEGGPTLCTRGLHCNYTWQIRARRD